MLQALQGSNRRMEISMNFSDIYTMIGNSLGVPVAIAFFWVVTRVKQLGAQMDMLNKENTLLKATLSDIRADVSYMRGKMEGLDEH